jgi:hypothetical protein
MMKHIILYLFRASVAFYFIYPSIQALQSGVSAINNPLFSCFVKSYAFSPDTTALVFHILSIVLGLLILLWKHPFTPLVIAILVLLGKLIVVKTTFALLMIIVPILLVSIGLAIYYSHHHEW